MRFSRSVFITKCCLFFLSNQVIAQQPLANDIVGTQAVVACPIPNYPDIAPITEDSLAADAIKIISSKTSIEKDQLAIFTGGVTLIKQDQTISAQEIKFNRATAELKATGDIHYQRNGFNVFASAMDASEESQSTSLSNTSYQLAGNPGHGNAKQLMITADGELILSDSSFTTCYGEVPDWIIEASKISISVKENQGEAYHARLRLFDVPVLYVPYFSFPVTDERKSGFLTPSIKTSGKSGLEVELPYYINISENYDATITPRYMSKRGLQLMSEFRYLFGEQSGSLNIEYLNKDNELKANNDPRYLWRAQHIGNFSENFRAHIDYTSISDDNYLVDIGSQHYNANDAYLYQVGELAYFGESWKALVKLQDFEVLGNHIQSYKTVPQIELSNWQDLSFLNGKFDIYSEFSKFTTPNMSLPEASRYHVEAGLTFPINTPAYFFNSEFRVLQTNYQQDRIPLTSDLDESVSRTLPKVRFHGGVNFERLTQLFDHNYTHTLEPQLQYLYIPNKDQSHIGIYDTTSLPDDYEGLFRDRRFSGLDRIAEANQYSWGVTTRLLDESNIEKFRFSVGRIVYLDSNNVNAVNNADISADESALAADMFIRGGRKWQFSGNIQYNTDTDTTNTSQANIDYQFSKDSMMQLNHRYTRNISDTSLEQLSLLSSVRLNKDWQFVGRITQDLQQKRSLESYAGLQYESCCWAIRVAYHRHINSNLDEQDFINENRDEFDSGFVIQFVFKGLGSQKTSVGTQDMFNSSIFGYKKPYFLNN